MRAAPLPIVLMIGPSPSSRGGIASVCAEYQRAGIMDRQGIRYLASYKSAGALVRLSVALRAALVLAIQLLTRQVCLVHVHMASGSSIWRKFFYCWMARVAGVPYIVHLHSGKFAEYYETACGKVRRSLVKGGLRHAARVLVLSQERKSWLEQNGLNQTAIEILPNMVSLPAVSSPPEGANLLFLGRLEEAKGVSTLLQAFAHLRTAIPEARLLLGGEGDRQRYEALAASLGIGNAVQFLGWVEGEAKDSLFAQAGVFVLPSLYEGLPMGVLEAMSWQVPCVATDVGGVPDIIQDGINGRLVPVHDPVLLARALESVLRDPVAHRALGKQARRTVESRYSTQAVEAELGRIYSEVTSK